MLKGCSSCPRSSNVFRIKSICADTSDGPKKCYWLEYILDKNFLAFLKELIKQSDTKTRWCLSWALQPTVTMFLQPLCIPAPPFTLYSISWASYLWAPMPAFFCEQLLLLLFLPLDFMFVHGGRGARTNMPELWCPDISWLTLGSQKLLLASCGSWPQWVRFVPAQVDLLGSLLCCCGYIAVWTVSVWTQNLYLSSHSKCWLHLVSSDDPVISTGNKV